MRFQHVTGADSPRQAWTESLVTPGNNTVLNVKLGVDAKRNDSNLLCEIYCLSLKHLL